MSIDAIKQEMEQNRARFAERSAELLSDGLRSETERRRDLAELWFAAMRRHYQLLGAYLQLRDRAIRDLDSPPARLSTAALRAPQRPVQLPDSLSRYVTAESHAELLI